MRRKETRMILMIMLIALLVRTIVPTASYMVTHDVTAFHDGDTHEYVALARNLVSLRQLTISGLPEIIRTPGYPLFLTPGAVAGHMEMVGVGLQIALSCLTVYLVYGITGLLLGRSDAAAVAAVLYAIEPLSVLYASLLMSETLFTALIVMLCFFLVRYAHKADTMDVCCAAAALAAAALVRPVASHLVILVIVVLTVRCLLHQGANRKWIVHAFLFLILAAVPVTAWQVRNYNQAGYWGLSPISGMGFYNYLAGGVLAEKEGARFSVQRVDDMETLLLVKYPHLSSQGLVHRLPYMKEEARKIIAENPLPLCKVLAKRAVVTLLEPVSSVYLKLFKLPYVHPEGEGIPTNTNTGSDLARYLTKDLWVVLLNLALFVQLVLYWVLAAIALMKRQTYEAVGIAFFSLIASYLLLTALAGGYYSRFRHPLMPFICVLSGYGAVVVYEKTRDFLRVRGTVSPG